MFFNNFRKKKANKRNVLNEKNLKDPVNFTKIISIFFLGFFVYSTIAVFLSVDYVDSFNDVVIILLPLPLFICLLIYLVDKDERIKMDNQKIQEEIDRVKDLYNARKKAEEHFDNI